MRVCRPEAVAAVPSSGSVAKGKAETYIEFKY